MKEVLMGKLPKQYNDGYAQNITFSVTEDCNLRCKYCYMVHKNSYRVMSFETAKKVVDFVLSLPPKQEAVVWEFIGGEPTLEMDLIDKITDYIKIRLYETNHQWKAKYIFFIGTNGVLYGSDEVQRYIKKNMGHVGFGITIDGTKRKHDLQRVKKDGSGSYDDVMSNYSLWQKQFQTPTTKVTFASDDLKYLKESIIHLWDIGLQYIAANVVFEDVWKEGDVEVYKNELIELADYIIDNKLWNDKSVRFFDPSVGIQSDDHVKSNNFCGTGKMLAVSVDGLFFPCVRFIDFCIAADTHCNKNSASIGNASSGLDSNRLRAFDNLSISSINDHECENCPISSGCFACAGFNYEDADRQTIYYRAKYICEMQKAQVEANKYFWRRYSEKTKEVSPFQENRFNTYRRNNWDLNGLRFYYILLSDDAPEFCNYTSKGNTVMSQETLENALDFIDKENAVPIFVGKLDRDFPEYVSREVNFKITTPDMLYNPKSHVEQIVHVIKAIDDVKNGECTAGHERACIVLICPQNIKDMFDICKGLIVKYSRINIVKRDFHLWEETDKKEYCKIIDFLRDESKEQKQRQLQINVITDSDEYGAECNAGVSSFTIAPNGRIYVCPGFYYESADNYIGDVVSGFLTNNRTNKLYERRSSPICSQCDNMKCRRCVFDNKKKTGNANIPSFEQCELAGL